MSRIPDRSNGHTPAPAAASATAAAVAAAAAAASAASSPAPLPASALGPGAGAPISSTLFAVLATSSSRSAIRNNAAAAAAAAHAAANVAAAAAAANAAAAAAAAAADESDTDDRDQDRDRERGRNRDRLRARDSGPWFSRSSAYSDLAEGFSPRALASPRGWAAALPQHRVCVYDSARPLAALLTEVAVPAIALGIALLDSPITPAVVAAAAVGDPRVAMLLGHPDDPALSKLAALPLNDSSGSGNVGIVSSSGSSRRAAAQQQQQQQQQRSQQLQLLLPSPVPASAQPAELALWRALSWSGAEWAAALGPRRSAAMAGPPPPRLAVSARTAARIVRTLKGGSDSGASGGSAGGDKSVGGHEHNGNDNDDDADADGDGDGNKDGDNYDGVDDDDSDDSGGGRSNTAGRRSRSRKGGRGGRGGASSSGGGARRSRASAAPGAATSWEVRCNLAAALSAQLQDVRRAVPTQHAGPVLADPSQAETDALLLPRRAVLDLYALLLLLRRARPHVHDHFLRWQQRRRSALSSARLRARQRSEELDEDAWRDAYNAMNSIPGRFPRLVVLFTQRGSETITAPETGSGDSSSSMSSSSPSDGNNSSDIIVKTACKVVRRSPHPPALSAWTLSQSSDNAATSADTATVTASASANAKKQRQSAVTDGDNDVTASAGATVLEPPGGCKTWLGAFRSALAKAQLAHARRAEAALVRAGEPGDEWEVDVLVELTWRVDLPALKADERFSTYVAVGTLPPPTMMTTTTTMTTPTPSSAPAVSSFGSAASSSQRSADLRSGSGSSPFGSGGGGGVIGGSDQLLCAPVPAAPLVHAAAVLPHAAALARAVAAAAARAPGPRQPLPPRGPEPWGEEVAGAEPPHAVLSTADATDPLPLINSYPLSDPAYPVVAETDVPGACLSTNLLDGALSAAVLTRLPATQVFYQRLCFLQARRLLQHYAQDVLVTRAAPFAPPPPAALAPVGGLPVRAALAHAVAGLPRVPGFPLPTLPAALVARARADLRAEAPHRERDFLASVGGARRNHTAAFVPPLGAGAMQPQLLLPSQAEARAASAAAAALYRYTTLPVSLRAVENHYDFAAQAREHVFPSLHDVLGAEFPVHVAVAAPYDTTTALSVDALRHGLAFNAKPLTAADAMTDADEDAADVTTVPSAAFTLEPVAESGTTATTTSGSVRGGAAAVTVAAAAASGAAVSAAVTAGDVPLFLAMDTPPLRTLRLLELSQGTADALPALAGPSKALLPLLAPLQGAGDFSDLASAAPGAAADAELQAILQDTARTGGRTGGRRRGGDDADADADANAAADGAPRRRRQRSDAGVPRRRGRTTGASLGGATRRGARGARRRRGRHDYYSEDDDDDGDGTVDDDDDDNDDDDDEEEEEDEEDEAESNETAEAKRSRSGSRGGRPQAKAAANATGSGNGNGNGNASADDDDDDDAVAAGGAGVRAAGGDGPRARRQRNPSIEPRYRGPKRTPEEMRAARAAAAVLRRRALKEAALAAANNGTAPAPATTKGGESSGAAAAAAAVVALSAGAALAGRVGAAPSFAVQPPPPPTTAAAHAAAAARALLRSQDSQVPAATVATPFHPRFAVSRERIALMLLIVATAAGAPGTAHAPPTDCDAVAALMLADDSSDSDGCNGNSGGDDDSGCEDAVYNGERLRCSKAQARLERSALRRYTRATPSAVSATAPLAGADAASGRTPEQWALFWSAWARALVAAASRAIAGLATTSAGRNPALWPALGPAAPVPSTDAAVYGDDDLPASKADVKAALRRARETPFADSAESEVAAPAVLLGARQILGLPQRDRPPAPPAQAPAAAADGFFGAVATHTQLAAGSEVGEMARATLKGGEEALETAIAWVYARIGAGNAEYLGSADASIAAVAATAARDAKVEEGENDKARATASAAASATASSASASASTKIKTESGSSNSKTTVATATGSASAKKTPESRFPPGASAVSARAGYTWNADFASNVPTLPYDNHHAVPVAEHHKTPFLSLSVTKVNSRESKSAANAASAASTTTSTSKRRSNNTTTAAAAATVAAPALSLEDTYYVAGAAAVQSVLAGLLPPRLLARQFRVFTASVAPLAARGDAAATTARATAALERAWRSDQLRLANELVVLTAPIARLAGFAPGNTHMALARQRLERLKERLHEYALEAAALRRVLPVLRVARKAWAGEPERLRARLTALADQLLAALVRTADALNRHVEFLENAVAAEDPSTLHWAAVAAAQLAGDAIAAARAADAASAASAKASANSGKDSEDEDAAALLALVKSTAPDAVAAWQLRVWARCTASQARGLLEEVNAHELQQVCDYGPRVSRVGDTYHAVPLPRLLSAKEQTRDAPLLERLAPRDPLAARGVDWLNQSLEPMLFATEYAPWARGKRPRVAEVKGGFVAWQPPILPFPWEAAAAARCQLGHSAYRARHKFSPLETDVREAVLTLSGGTAPYTLAGAATNAAFAEFGPHAAPRPSAAEPDGHIASFVSLPLNAPEKAYAALLTAPGFARAIAEVQRALLRLAGSRSQNSANISAGGSSRSKNNNSNNNTRGTKPALPQLRGAGLLRPAAVLAAALVGEDATRDPSWGAPRPDLVAALSSADKCNAAMTDGNDNDDDSTKIKNESGLSASNVLPQPASRSGGVPPSRSTSAAAATRGADLQASGDVSAETWVAVLHENEARVRRCAAPSGLGAPALLATARGLTLVAPRADPFVALIGGVAHHGFGSDSGAALVPRVAGWMGLRYAPDAPNKPTAAGGAWARGAASTRDGDWDMIPAEGEGLGSAARRAAAQRVPMPYNPIGAFNSLYVGNSLTLFALDPGGLSDDDRPSSGSDDSSSDGSGSDGEGGAGAGGDDDSASASDDYSDETEDDEVDAAIAAARAAARAAAAARAPARRNRRRSGAAVARSAARPRRRVVPVAAGATAGTAAGTVASRAAAAGSAARSGGSRKRGGDAADPPTVKRSRHRR